MAFLPPGVSVAGLAARSLLQSAVAVVADVAGVCETDADADQSVTGARRAPGGGIHLAVGRRLRMPHEGVVPAEAGSHPGQLGGVTEAHRGVHPSLNLEG